MAVVVTLDGATSATVTVGGVAEDTLVNIENITGGTGDDIVTGDTLANMGESAEHSVKFAKLALAFLGELGKSDTTWQADCRLPPDVLIPS